ncbi:MAG: tRNA (adenosine(37)-N6)-threonylcarbamoyltransferase complex ATPase subunit type 1 TsaE [Planctomycetaceae bacterium]
MKLVVESDSEEQTRQLGLFFAACLTGGLTVELNGQLGSGKTALVRAICSGLGVSDDLVNSPTFVLMQIYSGSRFDVCHFDTYRLADADEFLAIGAEEYVTDPDTICLIEWGQRVADVLPSDRVIVDITQTGDVTRRLIFRSQGPVGDEVLQKLETQT